MAKVKMKVEKTKTGFSAYAEKYQVFTTAKTVPELVANTVEAVNLYLQEAGGKKEITSGDLLFEMEMTSVFEVFQVINVKALAGRLGMNYTLLSQYATGKKKPSSKQTEKIMEGIHQIGRELSELRLIA
jgi:hypothetical protein